MTKQGTITAEQVRQLLDYNPDTGIFVWRHRVGDDRATKWWNTRYAGTVAGHLDKDGRLRIGIFDTTYLAHRLAWLYVYGSWPVSEIDHANSHPADNRISNLREASHSENGCNKGPQSNNKSGFKGVSFNRKSSLWRAYVNLNRKQQHLGYFPTPELAHEAYKAAASQLHGNFYRPA